MARRKRNVDPVAVAVIYRRVSTQEQNNSQLGLEAQAATCQDYAARAGLAVAATFTEAVSGGDDLADCPELLAAIAAVPPGGALLVAKRDRLGRGDFRMAMLERAAADRGARILSAAGEGTESDGPADIFMRRIVDAAAEYERLMIGVRTAAALRAKRARRERLGSTPLGYKTLGKRGAVVAVAAELEIVRRVRELRAAGATLQAIADTLTAEGAPTKRGGAWRPCTVALICRPRYLETVAA